MDMWKIEGPIIHRLAKIDRLFAEKKTCGRRMTDFGPWEYKEGLDRWEHGYLRWGRVRKFFDWLKRNITERKRFYGGTRWDWHWMPRVCSFCGCVHPDDAVRLIKEGWTVDGTTKRYKRYLEPPVGFHSTPPVKVYVQDFTSEDVVNFNNAIDEMRNRNKKEW